MEKSLNDEFTGKCYSDGVTINRVVILQMRRVISFLYPGSFLFGKEGEK